MAGVGALYVHVPFCARKCAYCDFLSSETARGDARMGAYVHGLVRQMREAQALGLLSGCMTGYVGGGTPSFLGPELLREIVVAMRECCPSMRELTCEANPDSLDEGLVRMLVDSGCTRLSVGVQSLDDRELCALGRIHTAAQAERAVRTAVASGLDVSVDLMCAIPEQTDDSWEWSLRGAISLGVGHVSVYPLSIEEGTPFARRYAEGRCAWNDEDVQATRMETAERVLEASGLMRYEVASYARTGKECAHNKAYWTGISYLGLGLGAASMLDARTYDKARELVGWLPPRQPDTARVRFSARDHEVEFLDEREAWAEDLMLGMRLVRGIRAERLDGARQTRERLLERGLVAERDGRLLPTHDGWLLGNELFGALWDLASSRTEGPGIPSS